MLGCPPWCCGCQKAIPPVAACGTPKRQVGTPIERIADIDAWRPEASMPGWPGWLAWLAGLTGWLGWLDWLGWMRGCGKSHTLDALKRSAEGQKAIRPVAACGGLKRQAGALIKKNC